MYVQNVNLSRNVCAEYKLVKINDKFNNHMLRI
jgi:hypothetical protein